MNKICFIDFETTGINVFRDAPIEFGAVLVDEQLQIIKRFNSRIFLDPDIPMGPTAFKVHGLTHEDLINEPSTGAMLSDFFSQFGTDYRLGGWNISFDVTFLRRICSENNYMSLYNEINHRHVDVQTLNFLAGQLNLLSRPCKSLSDLVEYFGLQRQRIHSAFEDAKLTFEVYKKLMEEFHRLKTSF